MALNTDQAKGFLQELFDFSFSGFIVPRIIRFLYIAWMIGAALSSLSILLTMFTAHWLAGLFGLVLIPVIFLVFVILGRVYCEMIMVSFELLRNVEIIARQFGGGNGGGGAAPIDGRGIVHNPAPSAGAAPSSAPSAGARSDVGGGSSAGSGWGESNDSSSGASGGSGWGGPSGGSSGSSWS